MKKTF